MNASAGFGGFAAPHWSRKWPNQMEERGVVMTHLLNVDMHPHPWVNWIEDWIPLRGFLIQVLINALWIPWSIIRLGRPTHSIIGPDFDESIKLDSGIKCEIAVDKNLDSNWIPPVGTKVRIYGDHVFDLGHGGNVAGDPPGRKTEIHPIWWLTWPDGGTAEHAVRYRITILADVSGRFPPYEARQRLGPSFIDAQIQYKVSEIFGPNVQNVTAHVVPPSDPKVMRQVTQAAQIREIDADTFEFTCQIRARVGQDADVCQTTERMANDAGYWDGWVIFERH